LIPCAGDCLGFSRRSFSQSFTKTRRALQTRLGRQAFFVVQGHRRSLRFPDASVEHVKHAPHQKERSDHQNREADHELGDA